MPARRFSDKERLDLDRFIWKLHVEGHSGPQIAERLVADGHYDRMPPRQRIFEAVKREVARHTSELGPDDYLIVETASLNEARRAARRRAFDPKTGDLVDIKAAELWLKLTERYHRLAGLDKPIKIDLATQLRQIAADEGLDADELIAIAERILGDS